MAAASGVAAVPDAKEKKGRGKGDSLYYRVKCRDNGVGMPHDKASRNAAGTRITYGWILRTS